MSQAKAVFQMAYDRFYGATAAKVFARLTLGVFRSFGGWTFRQDYGCRSYSFWATKAAITERSLWGPATDFFHLRQNAFQDTSVIFIARETFHAHTDAVGFGHDDGDLGPEFVLLVLLMLNAFQRRLFRLRAFQRIGHV